MTTTYTQDEMISKLQKIKAHADSAKAIGNAAEAAHFVSAMQTLLTKYKLEMSDIEFEQFRSEPMIEEQFVVHEGKRAVLWALHVAASIARAYGCFPMVTHSGNGFELVGKKESVDAAKFVIITTVNFAKAQSWIEYHNQYSQHGIVTNTKGYRKAWLQGFCHAIQHRCEIEFETQANTTDTALVRLRTELDDAEEYISNKHGNLKDKCVTQKSAHNIAGYTQGTKSGMQVRLKHENELTGHEKITAIK